MTMARCNNWPELLDAFIEARRFAPFTWTQNNCGFFACDWARAATGVDPAQAHRGLGSGIAIMRAVKREGGVAAIFRRAAIAHGWLEVQPTLAQRGDVVCLDTQRGPVLGVCVGVRSAFVSKTGLLLIATQTCTRAWRVN